ncbi:myrosinase 1-like [Plodia interpunctella]|uniref:myrosinase 1-like n=1 Tax=Plodia interpunctella TaxID=58824 RepID=UPI002367CF1A|nr:myrosinase 1-like [Plodia interpunctella]
MRSSSGVAALGTVLASLLYLVQGATLGGSQNVEKVTFPPDFMFGVSTAAFQIEGGWNADGKGESMWDTYLHKHPEYTPDRSNGDVAADSYHKYKEDIEMIKELNVQYYRFSLSWPRILPHGTDNYINKAGAAYYRTLIEELKMANITPVVTLFHWDLPTPLMDLGGWSNRKMVDYFVDYARVAFDLYGDIVKIWTTMNEPHQHCYNGYGTNYFVPALESYGVGDYLCAHYMLLAHAEAYRLYNSEYKPHQQGNVGITLDAFWGEPKNSLNPDDVEAAERYTQMHLGLYAHPIFSKEGDYPDLVRQRIDRLSSLQNFTRSRLPSFTKEEILKLRGSADFFGINHYTTFLMSSSSMEKTWKVPSMDHDTGVKLEQNPNWSKPGADWFTVYPPGFRKLFNWIKREYGEKIPIIVTENGMCDFGGREDYRRIDYHNQYLYQMWLAIYEDDCNVIGYFAWTLMDDFEWTDGYTVKFGLYEVDFNSPERTRTKKLSAVNYSNIARTKQIDFGYFKRNFTENGLNNII